MVSNGPVQAGPDPTGEPLRVQESLSGNRSGYARHVHPVVPGGGELLVGHAEGPAVVALPEATLVVPEGWSGTTDDPKLIPVNKLWMHEYRRGWQIWGIKAFLDHPALFYAKLAGMAGNWDMRRTPTGIPCGLASGLSAKMQSPILKMVYFIPWPVFSIDDVSAKYYTALRLSIAEPAGM
ncbi:MAG: GH3 auxin-responsive promoter family protein [Candidatus Krumholzibacteriota bacterium]|nr:GH3 auxin-responsive promoter family protein [Candidatus Krumholzibacteriota bacterium]